MSTKPSDTDKAILEARKKFGDMLGGNTKIGGKGNFKYNSKGAKKRKNWLFIDPMQQQIKKLPA